MPDSKTAPAAYDEYQYWAIISYSHRDKALRGKETRVGPVPARLSPLLACIPGGRDAGKRGAQLHEFRGF